MSRPQTRLSLFPAAPNPGETPSSAREAYGGTGTPGGQHFVEQKSQVLKKLAETLVELDKTEAIHFDALFTEEQHARERYVQQFQSIAGKVQQLSDEGEVDRSFRQEYHSAIAKYTQEQSQEIESFAQDMIQLRDLEHMVRGHLPVQLEALAALAHDIQVELRQKADMNASKSRLTQINQRLARLEEVIETKADRSELEAQQERMSVVIPDRNRLARAFEVIAPALRQPSTRHGTPLAKSAGKASGENTASSKVKAKSKGGATLGTPLADGESGADERKPSTQTPVLEVPGAAAPRPSTPDIDKGKHHGHEKAGSKAKALAKHQKTHSTDKTDDHHHHHPEGKAPAPAEGKAPVAKAAKASKPSIAHPPPAASHKDEAVPKASETPQPKA